MTDEIMNVQCANCGTVWRCVATSVAEPHAALMENVCPVCHMVGKLVTGPSTPLTTVTELKAQLDLLMRIARSSGIDTDGILRTLSDELIFAAEMGDAGRRFVVQLIDLGPQENELLYGRDEVLIKRRGAG